MNHIPPRDPVENELYEAKMELLERQQELYRSAVVTYPHLAGSAESIAALERFLLESDIDQLEAARLNAQERLIKLDTPEFIFDDAIEDFAKRFIEWTDQGCPTKGKIE